MTNTMNLSASLEDYLEAIYHLIEENKEARVKDVAQRLKVKYPSVTGALHSLSERSLINYAPYDAITLTSTGEKLAKDVIRRHEVLRDFFVKVLTIQEEEADKAACQLEHSIPPNIVDRLVQFAEFIETCPRAGTKWIAGFGYQCSTHQNEDSCEKCLSERLDEFKKEKKNHSSKNISDATSLDQLKPGESGKITRITARGEASKRIIDMGVTPHSVVEVIRVAPMGDPVEFKIKGYHLSLRKEEAAKILVIKL